jgi:NifB/MoaA-like Fe-S oxidoreductase
MHPEVNSISVVPVGITRYRDKLFDIKPYNKEEAHDILLQIKEWQNALLKKTGSRIVYAADEFYILAEQDLPKYEEYEDFYQLENGVGLVSLFEHEFLDNLHKDKKRKYKKLGKDGFSQTLDNNTNQKFAQRIVSIATGVSAGKFIKRLSSELENMYNNLKINVYPIKNNFFGEHVTVAGLLTGEDIVNELSGKELGVELLIPKTMLKSGTQLFLDGYTVKQVEKDLGVKIKIVKVSGKAFLDAVLGEMA